MSKRISRKALVLAAAGLLGSTVVATTAGAQTIINAQQTVTNSAKFVGPVPSGVTGVNVTVSCQFLTGASSQSYTASIPVAGGTGIMNFNLTSTAPGTSCTVSAAVQGTANTTVGSVDINVGGTSRATGGAGTAATGSIPIQVSTTVVVTVTYPVITAKKVVAGDEPVPGFAYPMTIACSTPTPTAFIGTGVNDIAGNLYIAPGWFVVANGVRFFDFRTAAADVLPAGSILGTAANIGASAPAVLAAAIAFNAGGGVVAPVGGAFTGAFALKGGESKLFGLNEFPTLSVNSVCEVTEINSNGSALVYSSTQPASAAGVAQPNLGGVTVPATLTTPAIFKSALTKVGQEITVQNWFFGDLIISKVVTGDPKTNIATFEISVSCDKGGPKDTFLLKDRQSKVYGNISVGTNCLITETRSDGAVASYADNSGDNTTDGRVTIKARPAAGCAAPGSPTGATPGGPGFVTTFNDCIANVIVTNNYNPPATTAAPAAPATTAAPAAPATTSAPAVEAAPAAEVEATPTFTG